jgi:hypothetical protein
MIGHDVAAALPELRAQAESLMIGSCDIDREVTAWDEALQESVTTWVSVHAGVPCAFAAPPATSRSLLTDGAVTVVSPQVRIPVGFDGIEPDDRVTVIDVGVVWVTHVPIRTNQVQTRIECRRLR